jgi:argininosuccinate lyase
MSARDESREFAEGVGGRLNAPKSERYRRSVLDVEGRANRYVARYMLGSDLAYVLTATELGLTPPDDGRVLLRCLLDLLGDLDQLLAGGTALDIGVQREVWVLERVPKAVAARLHIGRNRGESVRNYLPRMFFRDALWRQYEATRELVAVLVAKAEPVLETVIPVYHHLQHAGMTTLGESLLSWASNFYAYLERLREADRRIDIAPPVMTSRRESVAIGEAVQRRLGFSRSAPLRQQMHVTEDQFAEPFFALLMVAVGIARLAEDLRIYMTSEFAFFELADRNASGSSHLPQKKNPFGLQAIIGSAAVGVGRLAAQLTMNISPSEELESVFQAASLYEQADDIIANTWFMAEIIEGGRFDTAEMGRKSGLGFAGAPTALDMLMFDADVPMRVAHHELGNSVRRLIAGDDVPDLAATIGAQLGRPVAIDTADVLDVLRGDRVPDFALNLPAVHSTFARLKADLAALAPRPNPVTSVLDALTAEAEAVLGSKETA